MFKQFQNIDSAFKHIRFFSLAFLLANCVVCIYTIYSNNQKLSTALNKVYILSNGKLLEALATDRSHQLKTEVQDHVMMFHFYFFNLEPDDQAIKKHITDALYLADESAKVVYDNLTETGYYTNIIASNISQQIEPDSIQVDINQAPYYFKYFGKLKIERPTSIATRSLVTEGYIRVLQTATEHNGHGFLIERWKILENKDLTIEKK